MTSPITKAPETQPRERHPEDWTYPLAFLEDVEKSMPADDCAPGLEGIELALLGYEKATNTRLHVPGESAQSSYDSLARELEQSRKALADLQDGIAKYLADPLRKKTYVHAEVFIELCGELAAAALKPSNEVGT